MRRKKLNWYGRLKKILKEYFYPSSNAEVFIYDVDFYTICKRQRGKIKCVSQSYHPFIKNREEFSFPSIEKLLNSFEVGRCDYVVVRTNNENIWVFKEENEELNQRFFDRLYGRE